MAEHLVNDQLYWILESHNLQQTACAFRESKDTIDQLCCMKNTLCAGLVSKNVILAVSCDLSQAFESVHPQALLFTLTYLLWYKHIVCYPG